MAKTAPPVETPGGGWIPVPDPTDLTTEAVDRAKEDIRRELTEQKKLGDELLRAANREAAHVKEISDLRFSYVEKISELRLLFEKTIRESEHKALGSVVDSQAISAKEALTVALNAQKDLAVQQNEANSKSAEKTETNITKLIDQMTVLIKNQGDAQDARMVELKERIDRGEGTSSGGQSLSDRFWSRAIAVGAVLVSITAIIVVIVLHG